MVYMYKSREISRKKKKIQKTPKLKKETWFLK